VVQGDVPRYRTTDHAPGLEGVHPGAIVWLVVIAVWMQDARNIWK